MCIIFRFSHKCRFLKSQFTFICPVMISSMDTSQDTCCCLQQTGITVRHFVTTPARIQLGTEIQIERRGTWWFRLKVLRQLSFFGMFQMGDRWIPRTHRPPAASTVLNSLWHGCRDRQAMAGPGSLRIGQVNILWRIWSHVPSSWCCGGIVHH